MARDMQKLATRRGGAANVGKRASNDASTLDIAEDLAKMLHVPVVDNTSLKAKYNVSLEIGESASPDDSWDSA